MPFRGFGESDFSNNNRRKIGKKKGEKENETKRFYKCNDFRKCSSTAPTDSYKGTNKNSPLLYGMSRLYVWVWGCVGEKYES